jgi:hypothetical protein
VATVSELFDELIANVVQLSDKYDAVRVIDVVQLLVAVKQIAAQAQATADNSAISPCPYRVVERYADNGAVSHCELVEVATGRVVWAQPE